MQFSCHGATDNSGRGQNIRYVPLHAWFSIRKLCVSWSTASRNEGICLYMATQNPHSQLLHAFSSLGSDICASSPAQRAVLDDLSRELASNKALR